MQRIDSQPNLNQVNVQLELTASEVEVVLNALSNLPWKVADPIIRKILTQYEKALSENLPQEQKDG
jgi:hypothetical protein